MVSINDGARNFYVGDWIEDGTSYYHLGGQRVAKRTTSGVTYLHGDHLGSTSKTTGAASSAQLYEAYGAKRGASEVDAPYRYTGQRWEENDALDIYYYKARWYDPALGRFLQPDTITPGGGEEVNTALVVDYHDPKILEQLNKQNHERSQEPEAEPPEVPTNPQSLNRYAYTNDNPLIYADADGHFAFLVPLVAGAVIGGTISTAIYAIAAKASGEEITLAGAAGAFAGGAVAGAVSVIATPLAGTLLHAVGLAATGTALTVGTAAVNAAGGAVSYLASEAVTSVAQGEPFEPTVGGVAVNAVAAGAISPVVGSLFPVANSTMGTLRQAGYFMPGRTVGTVFATQSARNMYMQTLIATEAGADVGIMYNDSEEWLQQQWGRP